MLRLVLQGFFLLSVTCSELLSRHKRTWIIDSIKIEEEHPGPYPIELGTIHVSRQYRVFFNLAGPGVDQEPKGVLSIHRDTGTLYAHKPVDYEQWKLFQLSFEARRPDLTTDTKLGVEVSILDINDNPPLFQKDRYEVKVKEETTQGFHFLTVHAFDRDKAGSPNSTFHYEIKSVSPDLLDIEFFTDKFGRISFKGCLSYEKAQEITVLVAAKDHGDVVSLSSSTTVVIQVLDSNNHLPVISGQTGTGKVKEGETGSSPLRLHVTDADSPNTDAWRARYTVHGHDADHFKIDTDPQTNDGILTVVKPLEYRTGAQRTLSISVGNEEPYFSCKVEEKTSSGLWKVDTSIEGDMAAGQAQSLEVVIEVEDVNDPPVFTVTVKEAKLEENVAVGTWVEKVTAVDPDITHSRDFVYEVGHDPAGWVAVDPLTGDISTVKVPDRESPQVVDGLYTVLVHAVDQGDPRMTGTATLLIRVMDQNDNVPQLAVSFVETCLSDSPTTTNITAFDPDGSPYGGPFTFELEGNVKGKWKLSPTYGYTAGLVKEPDVYAGQHTVTLKVSDMQGTHAIHNLSVTVCDCSVTPNCRSSRARAGEASFGAIGIVLASLFLLLLLLLLAVVISCKAEFTELESSDGSEEVLVASNIEIPGTDCKIPNDILLALSLDKNAHNSSTQQTVHDGSKKTPASAKEITQSFTQKNVSAYNREDLSYLYSDNWNQTTWNSLIAKDYDRTHKFEDRGTVTFHQAWNSSHVRDATLSTLIPRRLAVLWDAEDNLDYEPHLYAEEGSSTNLSEFESIISTEDFSLQTLEDLGPRFNHLASLCKPPNTKLA